MPEALSGAFYRNGPARHERGGRRYHHWFDGDGMMQAFRIEAGRISHRGRFVATTKLAADAAAGQFVVPAFGAPGAEGLGLTAPDEVNAANMSPLVHAGELLAVWEAGSPHVLDSVSLETRGRKVWRADLKGLPFTAHPKVEPDGTLWAFGYDTADHIVLYHIGKDGAVRAASVLNAAPLGMVHDFVVTAKHLVFALPPLVIDPERFRAGQTFIDAHVWKPALGMRVLAVAKDDLKTVKTWQLPAGFNFHFGNAWEETDGTIRFDYCLAPDATGVTETLRYVMRGEWRPATGPTRFARVVLRPGKTDGEQEITATAAEFPRVAPAVVAQRYRHVYSLGAPSAEWYTAVLRWDLDSGTTDQFDYGDGFIAEEHVFVPRPGGGEADGWLIGTALDLERAATTLNLFDAGRIADGPIVRATLPYALPLGFHGTLAPA